MEPFSFTHTKKCVHLDKKFYGHLILAMCHLPSIYLSTYVPISLSFLCLYLSSIDLLYTRMFKGAIFRVGKNLKTTQILITRVVDV